MSWFKAKIGLLLIAIVWITLMLFMLPLMVTAFAWDKLNREDMYKGWLYSVLIAQDCLVHTIMGGYHKTTISSQLGYMSELSTTTHKMASAVDLLFKILVNQEDHCLVSMQEEDKYFFSVKKALLGAFIYLLTLFFSSKAFGLLLIEAWMF